MGEMINCQGVLEFKKINAIISIIWVNYGGKMTAFVFGVIVANIVAIFYVVHLLQEIGILQ